MKTRQQDNLEDAPLFTSKQHTLDKNWNCVWANQVRALTRSTEVRTRHIDTSPYWLNGYRSPTHTGTLLVLLRHIPSAAPHANVP